MNDFATTMIQPHQQRKIIRLENLRIEDLDALIMTEPAARSLPPPRRASR
jgi:hypothetical protein